jgi:hypothetical protein
VILIFSSSFIFSAPLFLIYIGPAHAHPSERLSQSTSQWI